YYKFNLNFLKFKPNSLVLSL
ncbi:hypothetical protein FOXB_01755, partial [Fusarium oxysporum f. sp. conglutinans Fo5176]